MSLINRAVIVMGLVLLCTGCRHVPESNEPLPLSIKEFTKDQLDTYWGQPFTFYKLVKLNGKTDSTVVSGYKVDWAAIFKTFFESDIHDKKFAGKYALSILNDDVTISKTYYYEAKDPDLFTRSFQIVTDPFTDKIKSIFIETQKNGFWNKRSQKLYYAPLKVIQIQEFESPATGPKKELKIEYRFI